jgi:hypothetical protein
MTPRPNVKLPENPTQTDPNFDTALRLFAVMLIGAAILLGALLYDIPLLYDIVRGF